MNMKKSRVLLGILFVTCISILTACSKGGANKVKLDPKNPIQITVWHYYNGSQQVAFNDAVTQFNNTVGKEEGIYVQGKSKGDFTELETAVLASVNNEVGSDDAPNIFSSYADTAYEIDKGGHLADISQYVSKDELNAYLDSYIEEGRIGENGELRIFPIAKSSEIFMLNKTDWENFSNQTGASLEQLSTKEGVADVAKMYYEWTDAKTPNVKNDGKSFYGRDAVANLFIIGSMQLGVELFEVNNNQVTLNIDKEVMRKIWDFYYVNHVKGYFKAYGRFRTDDVKINEIIACTGSSTSVVYFPDEVELEERSYPIEYVMLPEPIFEGGEKYGVQQGAGMAVLKSTSKEEYASVVFLKWITEKENNLKFAVDSSYLPVKNDAYNMDALDEIVESGEISVSSKTYDALQVIFDRVNDYTLYTNKAFEGGSDARKILEYNLSDKAAEDREVVIARLNEGQELEQAVSDFVSDAAFEKWFLEFSDALHKTVNK